MAQDRALIISKTCHESGNFVRLNWDICRDVNKKVIKSSSFESDSSKVDFFSQNFPVLSEILKDSVQLTCKDSVPIQGTIQF